VSLPRVAGWTARLSGRCVRPPIVLSGRPARRRLAQLCLKICVNRPLYAAVCGEYLEGERANPPQSAPVCPPCRRPSGPDGEFSEEAELYRIPCRAPADLLWRVRPAHWYTAVGPTLAGANPEAGQAPGIASRPLSQLRSLCGRPQNRFRGLTEVVAKENPGFVIVQYGTTCRVSHRHEPSSKEAEEACARADAMDAGVGALVRCFSWTERAAASIWTDEEGRSCNGTTGWGAF